MTDLFKLDDTPRLPVRGMKEQFPVRRIYCVGRNYAEHALEMGSDPVREAPFFFTKHASAVVPDDSELQYPRCTRNLHHEIELVLALGRGGIDIPVSAAGDCIFAYGVGNDLTRRDLQSEAKKTGRPWDTGKGFDESAPVSTLVRRSETGQLDAGEISLRINGELRQRGDLADMIWSAEEVVAELSRFFTLYPGDLVFTGTPAGVGPVQPGDVMEGQIEGVGSLTTRIAMLKEGV